MIRIAIVDDHALVRCGFVAMLQNQEQFQVLAEGESADDALSIVAQNPSLDVLILDLHLGDGPNGANVIPTIKALNPELRIMALSGGSFDHLYQQLKQQGVFGFLTKGVDLPLFIGAVEEVAAGNRYLDPSISYLENEPLQENPFKRLSDCELEVVQWLLNGYNTQEMAELSFRSTSTIYAHKYKALTKLGLGARDTLGLVNLAQQHDIKPLAIVPRSA